MASRQKGLSPGAVWRKCDFQCHAPRDPRWSGGDPLPSGSRELEATRLCLGDLIHLGCGRQGHWHRRCNGSS